MHHSILSLKTSIRLACKKDASAGTLMISGPATSLHHTGAVLDHVLEAFAMHCQLAVPWTPASFLCARHMQDTTPADLGNSGQSPPEVEVDKGLGHEGEGNAADEWQVIQDGRQADAQDGADLDGAHADRHHRRHVHRRQHLQLTCRGRSVPTSAQADPWQQSAVRQGGHENARSESGSACGTPPHVRRAEQSSSS